jgi:hypothetical protein
MVTVGLFSEKPTRGMLVKSPLYGDVVGTKESLVHEGLVFSIFYRYTDFR